ncbi:O-acetyl-ADP-ribose deacetylase [Arthrobacter mobilis]|uniref:O-acetyl-ADP-ribose deacetylase n=1 Tax=Arthrobacter mobilis TaxID=2724944 RepID=A0A7X6K779_9MICC|nr:O-acetyl-ADP-ribose deacetylase [Arthrobacter mobilis]NKX56425.1 O-acetyl-ADP-ribose deacetylase [Arthrobacter mobilis]
MEISILEGDITTRAVDAVVNAANSGLLGGGGVDGAIHAAAGPELLAACRELRRTRLPDGLPAGQAVATPGFRLPARWVIHTVGPNRRAGQTDAGLLASAFRQSLLVAEEVGARSVAFPAIGAGVFGWDAETVARAGLGAALGHDGGVQLVEFVLFNPPLAEVFRRVHAELAG